MTRIQHSIRTSYHQKKTIRQKKRCEEWWNLAALLILTDKNIHVCCMNMNQVDAFLEGGFLGIIRIRVHNWWLYTMVLVPASASWQTNTRRKNHCGFASHTPPLSKCYRPWSEAENKAKKSLIRLLYSHNWRPLIHSFLRQGIKRLLAMKLRIPLYHTNRQRSINVSKYQWFNRTRKYCT